MINWLPLIDCDFSLLRVNMAKKDLSEPLADVGRHTIDTFSNRSTKNHFKHTFSHFDCSSLRKMTDPELALWQADHPIDSPQYIMALQEWNRRALVEQINATKWSAIMGLVGVIVGVILTATFTWFLSPTHGNNQIQKQQTNQTSTQRNGSDIIKIAPPVSQKP